MKVWLLEMPQQFVVTYPATGGCRGNGRKANLEE